ncbi:MAG: DUF3050 domain-containing protein [Myxococcota bacterium]|nr:DUF3050 domain-containing protein [Myxococcota bacterium]
MPISTSSKPIDTVIANTQPLRKALSDHPLYEAIDSLQSLQAFMEHHVFSVWDFMSLLKALQRKMTCTAVPWTPPTNPTLARFINEIVLEEESDRLPDGSYGSHFDLYLRAMREVGANTIPIETFIELINQGEPIDRALEKANAPAAAARFTRYTLDLVLSGSVIDVAAAFTFGREDVIPVMFEAIVNDLQSQSFTTFDTLLYYLERHIELDGDEHGPLSLQLIENLCRDNHLASQSVNDVAHQSLTERTRLWDGVVEKIRRSEPRAA